MENRQETKSICDFFTLLAEHTCDRRSILSQDEQGKTMSTTFIGFACACGYHVVLNLSYVKAIAKPLRPYVLTTNHRLDTARRLSEESAVLLAEMRDSGGWFQPDPGVAMFLAMAAASGPPGNPMEKKLNELFEAKPLPV